MSNRRPNLLFVYADQHRADVLGSAGNDIVVTPNLDRLAAEGVRFDHAWTESPICRPARASLLTGRYPCDHGVIGNFAGDCQPEWDTFPRRLQQGGYTTASIGKTHYSSWPMGANGPPGPWPSNPDRRHRRTSGSAASGSITSSRSSTGTSTSATGRRPTCGSCATTTRSSPTATWCGPTSAAGTGTGTASPLPCPRNWTSAASWPTKRNSGSTTKRATDRGSCNCRSCSPTCRSWATPSGPTTTPAPASSAPPDRRRRPAPTPGPPI